MPEWKRKEGESHALCETMFHEDYTYHNNVKGRVTFRDPLNLSRCMRFYPQDDNQGGFFVAVFEKHKDHVVSGEQFDGSMSMDAWMNPKVRQKSTLDEIDEFAQWFEAEQRKADIENGVPENERTDLGLSKTVAEARANIAKIDQSCKIKCTSLSAAMAAKAEEDE